MGQHPAARGWRPASGAGLEIPGTCSQEDGLAGGEPWRGLQGPPAVEGEGRILSYPPAPLPPAVIKSGGVENCSAKGRSWLQIASLALAEATLRV